MTDNITFAENDISDELKDNVFDSNTINVEHETNNTINVDNHQQKDIWYKQETINRCFSSLVLSQVDNMKIDLFYLLKASITPLLLFDQIIDW